MRVEVVEIQSIDSCFDNYVQKHSVPALSNSSTDTPSEDAAKSQAQGRPKAKVAAKPPKEETALAVIPREIHPCQQHWRCTHWITHRAWLSVLKYKALPIMLIKKHGGNQAAQQLPGNIESFNKLNQSWPSFIKYISSTPSWIHKRRARRLPHDE